MANAIEMQALKAKKKALEDRLKLNPQDTVAKKQLDEVDNQIFTGVEEAQLVDPTQGNVPAPRGTPSPAEGAVNYPEGTKTNEKIPPKIPMQGEATAPQPGANLQDSIPPDVKQDAKVVDSGQVPQVQNKINEVDLNPPKGDGDKLPEVPLNLGGLEPQPSQAPAVSKTEPAEIPELPAQLATKPTTPPETGDTSGGGVGAQLENLADKEQPPEPTPTDVVPPEGGEPPAGPAPDTQVGQTVFEVPEDSNLNQQVNNQKTFEESPYQVAVVEGAKDAIKFQEEKGADADKARASLGGLLALDEKQKAIIAEKEAKGKEQYDLMKSEFDRIEMRDFVDGVVQSLGTMLAGIVGLASDLPIGQYYKAVDVFDPTKATEATKALYDAGMASLEESQKEKLAQLKGVFDAMWSEAPYKERMEYLKQMHDVTKSAVSSSQTVDNRPDAVSKGESTSTANKEAMTQAKEYADRAKAMREDKNYVESRARLQALEEILATGNPSGLMDVDSTKKAKQVEWNDKLGKSNITKTLNQPLEKLLGKTIMQGESNWVMPDVPSAWEALRNELPPAVVDPKTGKTIDPSLAELIGKDGDGAMGRSVDALLAQLNTYRNANVAVPTKQQVLDTMGLIKDMQQGNGLPVTGQTLLQDTYDVLRAGYAGGGAVNRVSDNKLLIADIADKYLGIPLSGSGFFTLSGVLDSKEYLGSQVAKHEANIYEMEGQAREVQRMALTGGGRSEGRVYPPLTDGITPNEVEPQPSRGFGEWHGLYADKLPKAKVLPDGDVQLPPAWNDPKVISTVDNITTKYGMKPQELMALIALESAETFDPRALELGGTGATGLIQFVPSTAIGLAKIHKVPGSEKWEKDDPTSRQEAQKWVAGLSLVNQLELVDTYLADTMRSNGAKDAKGIYTAIFRGSNTNMSDITYATPHKAYEKNRRLDTDGNGRITYNEWTARVTPYVEKYSKMKWGAKTQPVADNTGGAR